MADSVAIDMTNLVIRKRVVVLIAIHSLRLEIKGILTHRGSTIQAMKRWGFTSGTKVKLLAELSDWMEEETKEDTVPWIRKP